MHHQRRKFRLIRPKLQMHLILSFLGVSVLGLLVQYLVFIQVISQLAAELPDDGAIVMGELPGRLLWVLFGSSALLFPATLYVGVLATRRILGPIYRFEMYLKQMLEGKTTAECKLREGDEFMELCALINRATAMHRQSRAGAPAGTDATREGPRAAA
ncbi:MAG: hypothetical protein ACKVXR_08385 [Planctomycetota bacterium]